MNMMMSLRSWCRDRVCGAGKRSPKWTVLRDRVAKAAGACAVCDSKAGLDVHHIMPFHIMPERELDENNLVVLCGNCHLYVGHLGNYQLFNERIRDMLHGSVIKFLRSTQTKERYGDQHP